MQEIRDEEFEVLGYKVKFNPTSQTGEEQDEMSAQDVVSFVHSEAAAIRKSVSGNLDNGQLAILVALKVASDKLHQDSNLKSEINILEGAAVDALKYIEEVSSPLST